MKKTFYIILISLNLTTYTYGNNLNFYLEEALKNNSKLNSQRKSYKATQEEINISRSEFLPSLTIQGTQSSSQSTNRTNQSGLSLSDTNLDSESKSITVEQKIFQGFQGYNSLKKSQLEVEKAFLDLKIVKQSTILKVVNVYYDLIFKVKSKNFNLDNVSLFERQVESDRARLQKGEITLTDLAQSESSLAGANAKLIESDAELQNTRIEFLRIIGIQSPETIENGKSLNLNLPKSLANALALASKNNPQLSKAKIDLLIAQRELNIEKAKLSPSASINYSKSEKKEYSSTIDNVDEEKVEATISWPIIKGGKNFSSIKKYNYKLQQSKLDLEDAQNSTKSKTTNAWSKFKSSESVLIATNSQLEAAEIANEGIALEYDSSNTRTTLDLIQSRRLLLEARISNAKAERDFAVSKVELLEQLGELEANSLKQN